MSTYVAVKPPLKAATRLTMLMGLVGLTGGLSKEELHTTILYDAREETPEYKGDPNRQYGAKVKGVGILGDGLVIFFESPDLVKRHEELKAAGFVHSFPDLTPHMTVKYNPSSGDLEKVEGVILSLTELFEDVVVLSDEFSDSIV